MAKRQPVRRNKNAKPGQAKTGSVPPKAGLGPVCSACGDPLSIGERFCRSCGATVSGLGAMANQDDGRETVDADDSGRGVGDESGGGSTDGALTGGSPLKPVSKGSSPAPSNQGAGAQKKDRPWRKFAFGGAIAAVALLTGLVIVLSAGNGSSDPAAGDPSPSTVTVTSATTTSEPPPIALPGERCSSKVSADDKTTSCPFALNVAREYARVGSNTSFSAYSPTTQQSYTMRCVSGELIVCTGGNRATVYLRPRSTQ
jgi:hypothetical protein